MNRLMVILGAVAVLATGATYCVGDDSCCTTLLSYATGSAPTPDLDDVPLTFGAASSQATAGPAIVLSEPNPYTMWSVGDAGAMVDAEADPSAGIIRTRVMAANYGGPDLDPYLPGWGRGEVTASIHQLFTVQSPGTDPIPIEATVDLSGVFEFGVQRQARMEAAWILTKLNQPELYFDPPEYRRALFTEMSMVWTILMEMGGFQMHFDNDFGPGVAEELGVYTVELVTPPTEDPFVQMPINISDEILATVDPGDLILVEMILYCTANVTAGDPADGIRHVSAKFDETAGVSLSSSDPSVTFVPTSFAVPEPSAFAHVGVATLALLAHAYRRRKR